MAAKMNPNLAEAYSKAKKIREIEKGNPRIANIRKTAGGGAQVKTLLRKKGERGQPKPVDTATQQKNRRAVADLLESKGLMGLKPIPAKPKDRDIKKKIGDGTGNPNKEDLMEISGQLKKASKLHGNQSERVASVAKSMKGDVGNPHMKRSKSKYGM